MVTYSVDGVRLKQVREARGLSPAAAARLAGVSRQSLYGYERGSQTPRAPMVERLAEAYEVGVDFLTRPPAVCDGAIFYRSLASVTKTSRSRVEARFQWLLEIYDCVDTYVELPSWELPRISDRSLEDLRDDDFLEGLARELRQDWGLDVEPVTNVVALFEQLGVVFTRLPLGQARLDAFSLYSAERGRGFGVLNSDKNAAVRSRTDAAHEAFHLMTHGHMEVPEDFIKDKRVRNCIEDPAKRFPGVLLFPEKAFRDEVTSRSTVDDLLRLKPRWGLSVQAMVMRGKMLGIFDTEQVASMYRLINYRGWRRREPLDDQLAPERPSVLRGALEALVAERPIMAARAVSRLGVPATDAEELCGLPPGFLDRAQRPMPTVRVRARPKGGGS